LASLPVSLPAAAAACFSESFFEETFTSMTMP
jgi:hypothetical protein